MAYDEELAERLRAAVNGLDGMGVVEEKRMFGGLAFLVHGHMAVAVSGAGGIMVKVDPGERDALLTQAHVEPMVMRGSPTRGWLRVMPEGLADEAALTRWAARGVRTVSS